MSEIMQVGNLPAFLADVQPDNDAFGSGISVGEGLARVSVRGRAFHIVDGDTETTLKTQDGQYTLNAIKAVVIAARPGLSKRYYDKPYDPSVELEAACFSIDGISPNPGVPAAPAASCAACPMNVWGSGRGNSKLCADYKRVVIVPVSDNGALVEWQGEVKGFRLDIPAASLKNFRTYTKLLTANKVPVVAAVTEISFLEAEYPLLGFQYAGVVTEASYADIQKMIASPEVMNAISTDPIDLEAQVQSPPVQPQSLPPQQPAPAPAEDRVPDPEPAKPDADDDDGLDDMGLPELRALAAELGIEGADKRRSKGLREDIRAKRASGSLLTPPAQPQPDPEAGIDDPEMQAKLDKVLGDWG